MPSHSWPIVEWGVSFAGSRSLYPARFAIGLSIAACALAGAAPAVAAQIAPQPAGVMERLEVVERRAAFAGARFGTVGAYELIRARAHLRVDPRHPANSGIVDLDLAPAAAGGVRYVADLVILRPRDPARARRVMLAEVPNRGVRLGLNGLNGVNALKELAPGAQGRAGPPSFSTVEDAGNGFLLKGGYTLVWIGWQSDVPAGTALMRADLPIATRNGQPIIGRVEATTVFDTVAPRSDLALAYAPAPGAESDAVLTVRARPSDAARTLPSTSWSFSGRRTVRIERPADMDAGAIYQFVYTAIDPVVAGLGFAATRDVIAWLRYGVHDELGTPNPLLDLRRSPCAARAAADCARTQRDTVDVVIGSGLSQSGRYLRDMVWQGFNDDGGGRRVFDGLIVQIAGARKTFTNRRWAEPGRFSRQHEDPFVFGNQFPFGYAVTTDPITGQRDGLFATCERTATCPSVFHVDGSSEFWNAGAALVTTDGAGHDVALPANVRAYMIAGAPHAPTLVAPSSLLPANPLTTAVVTRALTIAMDGWLTQGIAPPPSRWPRLAAGELAPPETAALVNFPRFSGLPYSGTANPVRVTDYQSVPPRVSGRGWQVLVPTTDGDGNDRAGIRLPEIAVPVGTYLGWNPRKPGFAEGDLSFLFGSLVPFAATREARLAVGDPRLSLEERFKDSESRDREQEKIRRRLIAARIYNDAATPSQPSDKVE